MSDIAIKVENLSKCYHIGVKDRGLLSERISHGIRSLFSKNGKSQDPTEFWALRDVGFEIKKGDAVGIIGRNGSGKSTLLKILSRITEPTSGKITINGRVASLLEVGTGFHQELTGRENIFMNGAILGMKQSEIKHKFDEIVAFSGIEKFIDTPVKHYSSGMYVRLAFAVAAHLDPEILIIDEVLAVGDAEFQKKCLGKMEDVAKNQGRTVLFVSHNMGAVKALCSLAILMNNGRADFIGYVDEAISRYLSLNRGNLKTQCIFTPDESLKVQIHSVRLFVNGKEPESFTFDVFDKISVVIYFECREDVSGYSLYLQVNQNGYPLFAAFDISSNMYLLELRKKGKYTVKVDLPSPIFKPGQYSIDFHVSRIGIGSSQVLEDALSFEIAILTRNPRFQAFSSERPGYIAFDPYWNYNKLSS